MPKSMLIFCLLFLVLGLVGYNWYMRHSTFADVQGGGFSLPASEVEAVGELLADAHLDSQRVRVVEASPDQPCWSYEHWTRLDDWLRVYKRFGRFPGITNCIGIDRGHVVSLSLVNTELADLYPLTRLPDLRSLYLTGNRIEHLDSIPKPCRWTYLSLESNGLIDCAALADCTQLETLDISHNKLTTLPSLEALERLESLDASNNEMEAVSGLAGLPSLQHLNLYGNRLTTLDAITNLPRLDYLSVAGNMLETLDGLRDLPALRRLEAGSNRIAAVDAEGLAVFPSLRGVGLFGNNIRAVPPGFAYDVRTAT
ncbi:MAG TPA: leucine-rich repeat domain-containing protein, partial [Rhodothermales bacterium]|nr:leucine-rich repeat domain-containing protein [Rhodothermales bacterium]